MKNIMMVVLSAVVLFGSAAVYAEDLKCAFGDDLAALDKNKRFKFKKKIKFKTFKLDRSRDAVNPLIWVTVTEFTDKNTKKVYQVNATYDDAYDGGNTVGWIEDVTNAADGLDDDNSPDKLVDTGAVVAEISDSSIACLIEVK